MKPRRGELVKLGVLFEKYTKTLKPPQKSVERIACVVINEVTGLTLTENQVVYTVATKTLYIKAPALLRNEVKLRAELILKTLTERLGEREVPRHLL